jgi:hypothetical protein
MDQNEMSNLYRGHSIDASYQAVEEQTRNYSNFPVRGIFKNPREMIVNIFG